ncbi:DUF3021 family protein [Marinilactibacillus sp. XAAS-LB27]|uniref:DUF3021 family protein n=1 Tax=Marinilactibacillus sp. XAAS-LB27 TaxID=3114538 RepID=UPI002E174247|nr:DUF3021 family protein [Marinilactibacillus sp. XAAS-LB27]
MKLLKNALIRGFIPFVIMTGISLIMRAQELDSFQVNSTFITGIIITAVAAASVIYDIESWSIQKQSVVHFIFMLLTVFPCLLLSGWFPVNGIKDMILVLGVFIVIGALLWSIAYFVRTKLLSD